MQDLPKELTTGKVCNVDRADGVAGVVGALT